MTNSGLLLAGKAIMPPPALSLLLAVTFGGLPWSARAAPPHSAPPAVIGMAAVVPTSSAVRGGLP